jgi:hypothetical protein
MPRSEDNGENLEVVKLRKYVKKFKKRMRNINSWIGVDSTHANLVVASS